MANRLARDEATTITELADQAVGEWRIFDLLLLTSRSPQRVIVALSPEGLGRQLTGHADNYNFISAQSPPLDAAGATARAVDLLELTNDYSGLFYQVSTPEQVRWLNTMTAAEQAAKDAFVAEHGAALGPAEVTQVADGWQVTSWWMYQATLRRYTVEVASDGTLTSSFVELACDLPVSRAP